MGGCCEGERGKADIRLMESVSNTESNITYAALAPWRDAVYSGQVETVKKYLAEDSDAAEMVDEPIDIEHDWFAIHHAVRTKNHALLEFLLSETNTNVNIRGGPDSNTALHEAVILKDLKSIKVLYQYNVNDGVENANADSAIALCDDKFKRKFIKAKQKGVSNKGQGYVNVNVNVNTGAQKLSEEISLSLSTDVNVNPTTAVSLRDDPVTAVGELIGIDIDDIARIFEHMPDANKIWNKLLTDEKQVVTSSKDIYKLMYGLTFIALKKKAKIKKSKIKPPPQPPMRTITKKLCSLMPKKQQKLYLSKEDFVDSFQTYLYQVHEQLLDE